jgi:hypothetical protein
MNLPIDPLGLILEKINPNEMLQSAYYVSKQWRCCAIKALPISIDNNPTISLEKFTFVILVNKSEITAPTLKRLNLFELFPLTNAHLAKCTVFQNLESIDLARQKNITDVTPLAKLTSLQWVNLKFTGVKDVSPLTTLPHLSYLNLIGVKCSPLPTFLKDCKIVRWDVLKKDWSMNKVQHDLHMPATDWTLASYQAMEVLQKNNNTVKKPLPENLRKK